MTATKKAWMFKHEISRSGALFGRSHGVQVVFEGTRAHTDGKVITLPAIADTADLTQDQMMILRGYIDHEAGHLRHSDIPLILKKYEAWSKSGKDGLVHIQNSLEDIWMEPRVIQDYVGSKKNLSRLNDEISSNELKTVEEAKYDLSVVNSDTVGLGSRIAGRKQFTTCEASEELFSRLSPEVQEWSKKIAEEVSKAESSKDTIRIAKAVYKLLEEDPKLESNPEDFTEEKQQELADQVDDDGEDGEETEGQKAPYGEIHGALPGGISEDGSESSEGYGYDDGDGDGEGSESDGNDGMNDILNNAVPAIGRPTGDHVGAYRVYSTRGDRVISSKSPKEDKERFFEFEDNGRHRYGSYEEQKERISGHSKAVKTFLRRGILAQQRRDWEYGRENGTLNTRRLVAAVTGSTAVYKARIDREDLDTAIIVLIDQSGSMSGEKIKVARECSISIGEALEGTSISYSIVGFTCAGYEHYDKYRSGSGDKFHRYENNYMLRYKDFDQPLRQAKESISRMSAHSNNADYDALVWAISELKLRPERRKILMVLSDGEPACLSDAGQSELIRHARQAVKDGERMGVEVVGLGIQSHAVERIYDDHIVVFSLKEFAETYLKKFVSLLIKKGRKHNR